MRSAESWSETSRRSIRVTGNPIVLDTNAAIAALSGEGDAARFFGAFEAVYLPVPVIGELRYGALNSARPKENLMVIEGLTARCPALPLDERAAVVYAEVRAGLKRRGRPIPENDVWIAAICVQHHLPLATRDSHFQEIEGLRVVQF